MKLLEFRDPGNLTAEALLDEMLPDKPTKLILVWKDKEDQIQYATTAIRTSEIMGMMESAKLQLALEELG